MRRNESELNVVCMTACLVLIPKLKPECNCAYTEGLQLQTVRSASRGLSHGHTHSNNLDYIDIVIIKKFNRWVYAELESLTI